MNLDVSTAPELAQLASLPASAPPLGKLGGISGQVTTGRLAGLVRAVAADPSRWWHLVRFDPSRPVHLRLDAAPGYELWLVTTPPGYRGASRDCGPGCAALTVAAGELAERIITAAGGAAESQPASAKDTMRAIKAAHLVLDGALLAGRALRAQGDRRGSDVEMCPSLALRLTQSNGPGGRPRRPRPPHRQGVPHQRCASSRPARTISRPGRAGPAE